MLEVENLKKSYGNFEVLKGINFKIEDGCIYGFLGRNGAGKTTTLNILAGLIHYNGGNICCNNINYKDNKKQALKSIGYTPQSPTFYEYMTAKEYLSFIGTLTKMSAKEISSRSDEILKLVGLSDSSSRRISGYSGGMKQRLGIAVALFNKPKFLILDEPTAALDVEGRMDVLKMIKGLKAEGITVLLSSHILNDVERVCDDVSIIEKGEIIISDKLSTLKESYIQPIFDIEVENDADVDLLSNDLLKLSWIDKVLKKHDTLNVYVKDMNIAKEKLLHEISKANYGVTSFNLRKSSLEDIFIRLVNKNEQL